MHLFVDSNTLLHLYTYSDDSLDELQKLSNLLKNKTIVLHIPQQVVDEVRRNRDSLVVEGLKILDKMTVNQGFPRVCGAYEEEYKIMRSAVNSFNEAKAQLISKLKKDINNATLKADIIIDELFENGKIYEVADDVIKKAQNRQIAGNPPGKNNSYGDAINWESLLKEVPAQSDLHLVSGDGDYASALNENSFNVFLENEWANVNGGKIHFYTSLYKYFEKNAPQISLTDEQDTEKNELIDALATSPNFATTHLIIGKLSQYPYFSDAQVRKIIDAGISNPQINRIASDHDVEGFYSKLIRGRENVLDRDTYEKFLELFTSSKEDSDKHDQQEDQANETTSE